MKHYTFLVVEKLASVVAYDLVRLEGPCRLDTPTTAGQALYDFQPFPRLVAGECCNLFAIYIYITTLLHKLANAKIGYIAKQYIIFTNINLEQVISNRFEVKLSSSFSRMPVMFLLLTLGSHASRVDRDIALGGGERCCTMSYRLDHCSLISLAATARRSISSVGLGSCVSSVCLRRCFLSLRPASALSLSCLRRLLLLLPRRLLLVFTRATLC